MIRVSQGWMANLCINSYMYISIYHQVKRWHLLPQSCYKTVLYWRQQRYNNISQRLQMKAYQILFFKRHLLKGKVLEKVRQLILISSLIDWFFHSLLFNVWLENLSLRRKWLLILMIRRMCILHASVFILIIYFLITCYSIIPRFYHWWNKCKVVNISIDILSVFAPFKIWGTSLKIKYEFDYNFMNTSTFIQK